MSRSGCLSLSLLFVNPLTHLVCGQDPRSAWSQKHNRLLEDYRKFGVSGLVRVEDLPHYSSLSGSLAEQLDWTSGLEDSKRGHATPEKSCKEEGAEDVLSASPKSVLSYLN